MTLIINDPELDRMAQQLADATGVSVEEAVREAVKAKLQTCGVPPEQKKAKRDIDWEAIREIQRAFREAPVLDDRTPDEIIGYDEHGLPR